MDWLIDLRGKEHDDPEFLQWLGLPVPHSDHHVVSEDQLTMFDDYCIHRSEA